MNDTQRELETTGKLHTQRLQEYMKDNAIDAFIVRANANLRWLTAAPKVFDEELAHVGFITADAFFLRTDARYYQTFVERLGDDSFIQLQLTAQNDKAGTDANWIAEHISSSGAHNVAVEDSITIGFMDDLLSAVKKNVAYPVEFIHARDVVENLRIKKDSDELALMQRAQDVTDDALTYIVSYIQPGMTEKQIAQALDNYILEHGGDAISFPTILASGPHGALPHAQPDDRKVEEGDLIVIDFGAVVGEYHADMTRTVSLGEPSQKQRSVYEVVRRAHERAAEAVHPDVIGSDIHNIAADTISEAGYGEFFGHGLGHGVGIEIHENPGFRPAWNKPVPKGSVVTIEPGIYLPGEFGIRLEDTGVVDDEGFKPFTRYNHDLIVIEPHKA